MRALLVASALSLAAGAEAAPTVQVRARTAITLDPIKRVIGGITVSGQVTDLASPEPIANATVELRLDGAVYYARTDDEGRFEIENIAADEGRHDVSVKVSATDQYDASVERLPGFDVRDEPLQLDLSAQLIGKDLVRLVLRASSAGGPAQIRAALWVGDLADPELRRLGDLVTDARGRATLEITRASIGNFGQKRAEARFAGDQTYDPANASTTFTIQAGAELTFAVDDADIAFEDVLRARGTARDERGEPLSGQRVSLIANGRAVAEATTKESGAWAMSVEASELGDGENQVYAELSPSASWIEAARSKLVVVRIGEQRPVPLGATLAAFGATCVALLAFIGLRTRPWERWLARIRRQEPEAPARDERAKRRPTGLAPARPSLVSTLRRAADFGFTGVVTDAVTGRPIGGAEVRLEGSGDHRREITGGGGGFAHESLAPGEWRARVAAGGYVSEQFAVLVPHRGELRNARVTLLAVREKIFDLYGQVAAPLLPRPELWGVWTPRQIVDHVRRNRPAPALSRLTDYVEEVYFSQRTPGEDALEDARQVIDAAGRELDVQP